MTNLHKILNKYISKDVSNIIIDYIDIEGIYKFIQDYENIWIKKNETFPPEYNFKHRRLFTLLGNKEAFLFDDILNNKTYTQQIDKLISIAKLATTLEMEILFEKCMAVIAMKIKDKQLDQIEEIFS